MKSKRRKPSSAQHEPPAPPEEALKEEALPRGRVVQRPDGYYWESKSELSGPFATREEAEAAMLSGGGEDFEDSATLQEAESELGIAEWIDPDTGVPAEDNIPRIEDH